MPGLDYVRDDLFGALEEAGELTVRVSMFPTLLEDRSRLAALQAAHTGPLLSAQGFKQFFDGVSSQHTAWVHDPYTNARFEGDCGLYRYRFYPRARYFGVLFFEIGYFRSRRYGRKRLRLGCGHRCDFPAPCGYGRGACLEEEQKGLI